MREAQPEFLDARLRQAAGWAGNAGGADQRSADSHRCRNARYTVERLVAIHREAGRSVPHTPHASTRTMTSSGASGEGAATVLISSRSVGIIASGPIRDIVGTTHGSPVIRATTDRGLTGIGRC